MIFVFIWVVFASLFSSMKKQRMLALENLALRQQVVMLKRSVKRARPSTMDRIFWIAFASFVGNWRESLIALHPERLGGILKYYYRSAA